MFDKHLTPNLLAAAVALLSLALPEPWQSLLLSTGLFALSGSLTNWLAVHMLFERVPGLYGSGVITLHFEEFKLGILRMVHEELFAKDKVERLLSQESTPSEGDDPTSQAKSGLADAVDLEPLLTAIDLDAAYDQLVATIVESSFGSMLAMVGGETALQPLREPFKERMHGFLADAAKSPRIQAAIGEQLSKAASSERFVNKLDTLLRARLDEMTPEMVRDIMQRMIREHLGWLVVWGGVFGGLIGLVAGLFGVLA
ncbi:DUF445 domain-containing protein [Granulosicoccus antarcticus]|uniref:DUF445 domain-containing protein n=1 Tax=Granulosicoccus antarcticus IMCC3135 TaxID=1192854 RepID=A0A2Z2NW90_9GAMM|nr:DUF445 domain-containing protein [Granulosicoccus antarcticus]ASJ75599.1 hypothetical protein IMCC3135_27730 [Granulosicoccus antarcticus IMCC3135]